MAIETPEASTPTPWPQMPWREWGETIDTVHMWTQIVGKIRMALTPPLNQWWHVPLYVSPRGLRTSAMPYHDRELEIELDFVDHRLTAVDSAGRSFAIDLRPMSVATFYRRLMTELAGIDVEVRIRPVPNEVVVAIPFAEDEQHASYDRDHVAALFEGLTAAHRLLLKFRGRFVGKASPVHFFWGGFDLAASRFSGAPAPLHPGGIPNCPDWVMEEAYRNEESSAGWWPASPELGPVFYAYTYPEPKGIEQVRVLPHRANFDGTLGEFILRDGDLAGVADPEATILEFLQRTYEAGANLAGWDRASLEADYEADGRIRGSGPDPQSAGSGPNMARASLDGTK
jgi:Family of unknown function (DUF5996)